MTDEEPKASRSPQPPDAGRTELLEAKKDIKRKRSSPSSKDGTKNKAINKASTSTTRTFHATSSLKLVPPPPPQRVLIIDNGGDTVKFGWNSSTTGFESIPNVTARLPQQVTILVGDQLQLKVQNPNSLLGVTRSMERGVVTNLGNQVQVWKRILDLLHVSIPLHTETAKAFGWKPIRASSHEKGRHGSTRTKNKSSPPTIPSTTCAVFLTVPPFCPRCVLDQMAAVWLHDFGFDRLGFACSPLIAYKSISTHHALDYGTCCVVDVGWSATHIVPMIPNASMKATSSTAPTSPTPPTTPMVAYVEAIRRMPLAGRHLINILKYHCSYRQWNLMDQEWLVKRVMEQTGLVSLQFEADMALAQNLPAGKRPYDREYVLPDFITTLEGSVRLPAALEQQLLLQSKKLEERGGEVDEPIEVEDDDDSDVNEEDVMKEVSDEEDEEEKRVSGSNRRGVDGGSEDDSAGDDGDEDEDETPEQLRQRLLKQREAEAQRSREQEAEQQVLNLSVERFAIPEALFRPSDVGLPSEWAGLPAAIAQSIASCPEPFQPALYQSIYLVGGLSQLPGLMERLERELRAMAPCEYEVHVAATSDPVNQNWIGACLLSQEVPIATWSITRDEYTERSKHTKRGMWKRLEQDNGGYLV